MERSNHNAYSDFTALFSKRPQALAEIKGSSAYPHIRGHMRFYQTRYGVFTVTELTGLPRGGRCMSPVFAFHIHAGGQCTGNAADLFANAGTHYNPQSCPHPYHAGDLPPLWGVDGYAFSAFLTGRFTVAEIIEKTVVVHKGFDDFSTQPTGNAGEKIACGEIRAVTDKKVDCGKGLTF